MVKRLVFMVTFLLALLQAQSQDRTITGKVIDDSGNTLPGATVSLKGTSKATVTDINGGYTLIVPATGGELIFSYVGYQTQNVEISANNVIDVNMQTDVTALNEIVVIGYGVQKKSLVTGAIAKVKADEIASEPSLRIEQALQGRTSGVVFNQTSGNPGAGITVRIRGISSNRNSDPLFIIDGMKTNRYVMNEIDPADIESVEVLKDAASSAIYGSEGANGVIIVTTKSGSGRKDKAIVNYDAYYGWQVAEPAEAMSADQYRDYFREAYAYDKQMEASTSIKGYSVPGTAPAVEYWNGAEDSLLFNYNSPEFQYDRVNSVAGPALQQALTDQQAQLNNGTIDQSEYNSNVRTINRKIAELAALKPLTFEQYKANLFNKTLVSATDKSYKNIKNYADSASAGTNWMDEIFQTAPMQKHHISVQTGSDKSNLYLSASYYTQDGVVGGERNNFTRYNFKAAGDVQATKWLKLGSNVTVAQSKSRNIVTNDLYDGVIAAALAHDPTIPAYWNDTSEIFDYYRRVGLYPSRQTKIDSIANHELIKSDDGRWYSNTGMPVNERTNPLAKIQLSKNDKTTTERIIGNTYAEIKPFSFLSYRISYSGELTYVTNDNWGEFYYLNNTRNRDYSYVDKKLNRYYNSQIDNVITFQKNFNDHGITIMAGQSVQEYLRYGVEGARIKLQELNDDWAYLDAVQVPATDTIAVFRRTNAGAKEVSSMMGYFGRVNYDFKEKYLFGATIRRDGVSKFEQSHRWGYFPSFSAGWNIHKESFFNVPFISQLKLRGSWGQNGSHASASAWQWISTKTASVVGGTRTVITGVVKNPDLTWETSEQLNIGLDLGMLKNKLTLTAEWYNKKTKDLLAVPVKAKWTDEVPYTNVGEISNSGIELDLGFMGNINEIKLDAKLTATYLVNEVTSFSAAKLNGYGAHGAPNEATAFEVGKPVWYFRGYQAEGIFQNWDEIRNYTYTDPETGVTTLMQPDAVPGDIKIKDVGGKLDTKTGKLTLPDGRIDNNDFTDLGKPLPTWTFGLNLNAEFKGIDASIFFYSEIDKIIYNNTLRTDFLHLNRPASYYTERWTPSNGTNDWFRARYQDPTTGSTQIGFNSLFFEDASFLKLKNLQIGYTLPVSLTQKLDISKFRIYVSGTNLWTLTGYSGSDPEIGITGGNDNYTSYGVDRGMYPSAKQYIVGVNVTF